MSATDSKADWSEPEYSKANKNNTNVIYYKQDISDRITPDVRRLLETYSNVPSSEVIQHVHKMRDQAWAIRQYPCTGLGIFLDPLISKVPVYPEVITRLQKGAFFLDIGSFIGFDLRQLVFDGAPSDRLYAMDIVSHWEVGYDMFKDRDQFKVPFMKTDILSPHEELLALRGTFDFISIMQVFHQWNVATQIAAMEQLIKLSCPGAMIVGFHIGSVKPLVKTEYGGTFFSDAASFQDMWDQAAENTKTKWKGDVVLKPLVSMGWNPKDTAYLGEDARVVQFVFRRIDDS